MLVGATGFAPRPWGMHVEALESSIVRGVRRQAFEGLVERNPALGTQVARLLGERLIETEGRRAALARKEVPERLASQILRLVASEGVVTREGYRILTRYTHQQLAVGGGRGAKETSDLRHRPGSLEASRPGVGRFGFRVALPRMLCNH